MSRPIVARFSLSAMQHNLQVVRRLAPSSRVAAVIKANAYGHGTLRVAHALQQADAFALLNIEAAAQLRHHGLAHPIIMLEGMFGSDELPDYCAHHLIPVVHQPQQLEWLLQGRLARPLDVWIKLNTGMNRLGFTADQLPEAVTRLGQSPNINRITLMSHFADADRPGGCDEPLIHFNNATSAWPIQRSLANSAAIIDYPPAHGDWVRPGIMLYGASPFSDRSASSLGLLPVMTLQSRIIGLQHLHPGDRVGYGATYTATRQMRIGIVACGYADGYPRHAPTGTPILVDGARTQTIGRVSMDMLAVDLSELPQSGLDSPVTLWGDGLSVDEVAHASGTIGYELLCALAPRVPVMDQLDPPLPHSSA